MAALTPEELAQINALITEALKGIGTGPTSSSTSSSSKVTTKLTQQSAFDLLSSLKDSIGYTSGLSGSEVTSFMEYFNAEQSRRITSVATSVFNSRTPGAKTEDLVRVIENQMRTEYPQFYDAKKTATDWLWNKVNFGDTKNLAGKNLATLSSVRNVVSEFQILGYSDTEALTAAKDIAMGKYTLADFTAKLQQKAIQEYPQFKDRFAQDPTLTTKGIAQPIINMLAELWAVDPASIPMTHPIITQYLRPGGADGKGPGMSFYDAQLKGLNDPLRELSPEANTQARDSAISFASAIGFGI